MYFEGKAVCISGKISGYTRTEVIECLEQLNAVFKPNVSNQLDILVLGHTQMNLFYEQKKTTKHIKVERLIEEGSKIEILTEENFLNIVMDNEEIRY
ncbi:BRCT domain-containing protein [Enterococcus sp. AZ072]|uniref:BRCT domain-containing protein n=1 Tax=unclassified Enterococcus TaxID=2608891 RepID=UPI003D26AC6C